MKSTIVVISCEHAVNTIPKDYVSLFEQQKSVLQTHRAIDFGALDIATHMAKTLGCESTAATVSRLIIDCNRSITHPNCFSEFTQKLPYEEQQTLINTYYLPFRALTEKLIKAHIEKGQQVLHISVHSFTPVFEGVTRNAGIGLLYDPKHHGEREVARLWEGLLSQQTPTYRVRKNYPYAGRSDGFTTALRKRYSETDYLGIELEINQTLVLDKETLSTVSHEVTQSLQELLLLL